MTPVSQYWFTFGHFCRKARALSIFGHERDNIMLGCSWHFSRLISWLLAVARSLSTWMQEIRLVVCRLSDPLLLPFFVQYKFSVSRSEFQGIFWSVGWILWRGQRSKLLSARLKRINVQCFLLCQIFKSLFSLSNWVCNCSRVAEVVQFQFQGSSISIPVFQKGILFVGNSHQFLILSADYWI